MIYEEITKMDIVFCIDTTGSMGPSISRVAKNVIKMITGLKQLSIDIQMALVSYKDYKKYENSHINSIVYTFPFTKDEKVIANNVSQLQANGGNDYPEAVATALHTVSDLPFRKEAAKMCVLITDAPPHGICSLGDEFPEGDPDHPDLLSTIKKLKQLDITVYPMLCSNDFNDLEFGFYNYLAETTNGQIMYSTREWLVDLIMGCAVQEVQKKEYKSRVRHEIENKPVHQSVRDLLRHLQEQNIGYYSIESNQRFSKENVERLRLFTNYFVESECLLDVRNKANECGTPATEKKLSSELHRAEDISFKRVFHLIDQSALESFLSVCSE